MAIWALVLGWVPCVPGLVVSVVLAVIVLVRSRDGRAHGRGLAITGLVGVGCWVLLVVGVFVVQPFHADRDSHGELTGGGVVTIDGLRVGDCGTRMLSGLTRTVDVVPCRRRHVFEVLATFEMSGTTYPGDGTVQRLAEGGCIRRLARVPGVRAHPDLHLLDLHPVASTWSRQRTVVCMAASDHPTTGHLSTPSS